MKNKINFIKHLSVFLFSLSLSAQVSMSFQNVQYTNNGEPKRSGGICGTIDLRSSTSTLIEMNVNILTVRSVINNADSDLYVYSQKSPLATRIQRHLQNIPSSNFVGQGSSTTSISWSRPISFFINAADYNEKGGTLFLIFKSPGGLEYRFPCTIPIIKAPSPSFTLTPTTVGLTCGDTAARTFTVTAANIPLGATVTYNWSAPGWTQVNSTTNSRTFQPSSGSILPSAISVTPVINGVAQPTLNCTVTRTPFTSTAAISGVDVICTTGASAIYSFLNACNLPSAATWSVSSNLQIVSSTSSSVTVSSIADGQGTITATFQNGLTFNKTIWVGEVNTNYLLINNTKCEFQYKPIISNPSTTFFWEYVSGTGGAANVYDMNLNQYDNNLFFNCNESFTVQFKLTATNACGSVIRYVTDSQTIAPGPPYCALQRSANLNEIQTIFKIYPNPSNDVVNIALNDGKSPPSSKTLITGELFDLKGQSRRKVEIKNNSASLSVAGLKKGIYVLHINIDGKVEGHQVIVE